MKKRRTEPESGELLAHIVRQCVREGARVEIDGIGAFTTSSDGRLSFRAQTRPRIFVAYVEEDLASVRRLAAGLRACGFEPWLDKLKLLPGQNWPRAIEEAIDNTDFFLACFSRKSLSKRGAFQGELRFALECARRMPLDDVFLIPVRLEECDLPPNIQRSIQYVDLFPNWEAGLKRLRRILNSETLRRDRKRLRLVS